MGASKRNTRRLVELNDLLLRLETIRKQMPQDDDPSKPKASGDRFLVARSEFLEGVLTVKEGLRELHNSQSGVRTREQITKAQRIRTNLRELATLFQEMETLYTKEARKKKSKVSKEELENRRLFLIQFQTDLQKLKELSMRALSSDGTAASAIDEDLEFGSSFAAGTGASGYNTSTYFKNLGTPDATGGGGGGAEPLTSSQQQTLTQIKERDLLFDQTLDLIGQKVLEAGQKAKAIEEETNLQNRMLDELEENFEKTKEKINSLNVTMKKNLEDKGLGMEKFCINFMCVILLLGVIGIIVVIA